MKAHVQQEQVDGTRLAKIMEVDPSGRDYTRAREELKVLRGKNPGWPSWEEVFLNIRYPWSLLCAAALSQEGWRQIVNYGCDIMERSLEHISARSSGQEPVAEARKIISRCRRYISYKSIKGKAVYREIVAGQERFLAPLTGLAVFPKAAYMMLKAAYWSDKDVLRKLDDQVSYYTAAVFVDTIITGFDICREELQVRAPYLYPELMCSLDGCWKPLVTHDQCQLCGIYCGEGHCFGTEHKAGRIICAACLKMWISREKMLGRKLNFTDNLGPLCWWCSQPTRRTTGGWYCSKCNRKMPNYDIKTKGRRREEENGDDD